VVHRDVHRSRRSEVSHRSWSMPLRGPAARAISERAEDPATPAECLSGRSPSTGMLPETSDTGHTTGNDRVLASTAGIATVGRAPELIVALTLLHAFDALARNVIAQRRRFRAHGTGATVHRRAIVARCVRSSVGPGVRATGIGASVTDREAIDEGASRERSGDGREKKSCEPVHGHGVVLRSLLRLMVAPPILREQACTADLAQGELTCAG
jgi:hypothetical protein